MVDREREAVSNEEEDCRKEFELLASLSARPGALRPPPRDHLDWLAKRPAWRSGEGLLNELLEAYSTGPLDEKTRLWAIGQFAGLWLRHRFPRPDPHSESKGDYRDALATLRGDAEAFRNALSRLPPGREPWDLVEQRYGEFLAGIGRPEPSDDRPIDYCFPGRNRTDDRELIRLLNEASPTLRRLLEVFADAADAGAANYSAAMKATGHPGPKHDPNDRMAFVGRAAGILQFIGIEPAASHEGVTDTECGSLVLVCARVRGEDPSRARWVREAFRKLKEREGAPVQLRPNSRVRRQT